MKPFTKTTVKTYTPIWIHLNFCQYTEKFIQIRSTYKYKGNSCFKCNVPFKLDEYISIGCFKEIGNKLICNKCAEELNS